jgi:hypothetical protein
MPDLLQPALDYLAAGLHILALTGKKPNMRVHGEHWSWEDSFWGTPEGTQEAKLTQAFSEKSGTTGIAILIPENFLVADVDTDAAASLLLELGFKASDETIAAQTKNGVHIWFWFPGASKNRWLGNAIERRILLFKGFGGYVVAPPSIHFDTFGNEDGSYGWITPLVVDGMAQFPDILPGEAGQRLLAEDQFDAIKPEREAMAHFTVAPADGVAWWLWEKHWNYNTEGLERAIETAADGNQNNLIHWAAMTCREEGIPLDTAMDRLMAAAKRGNHPLNRARDTIRGAYKRAPRG